MPSRLFLLTPVASSLLQSRRNPADLLRATLAGKRGSVHQVFAHFLPADEYRFIADFVDQPRCHIDSFGR
jgi:hypothetical protein